MPVMGNALYVVIMLFIMSGYLEEAFALKEERDFKIDIQIVT